MPRRDEPESVPLRDYLDSKVDHLESRILANAALAGQRFDDQDKAVLAALAAQEKAVGAAMVAADRAVAAALAAADRAVAKAETAAERRFDSVNEFRAQLSDQSATFMSRAEGLLQIKANTDKIDALSARVDRGEGGSAGSAEARTEQRQTQAVGISQVVLGFMGISILISLAAIVITLVHH